MSRTLAIVAFIGVLLAVDTQVDARAQLLLGLAAWVALALALRGVSPLIRAQTLVVVVVATCAEVVGSIIWGVYTYRLENLPSFVPPCHGLVYLAGFSLAAAASNKLLQGCSSASRSSACSPGASRASPCCRDRMSAARSEPRSSPST